MLTVLVKSSPLFITHIMTFSFLGIPLLLQERGVIPVMAMLMPLWISSSVIFSERDESYSFLRTLPITDRQTVTAKFVLLLLAASVYWLIMVSLAVQFGIGTRHLAPNLMLIHVAVIVGLLAAACWYMGIWLLGLPVMTVVVLLFMALTGVTAVVARFGIGGEGTDLANDIVLVRLLAGAPWYGHVILILAGLLAYYGLFQVAVRVKSMCEASS